MPNGSSKSADRRRGENVAPVKRQKPAQPESPALKSAPSRAIRAAERREAIIEAALDEFIARGYAAARLDDVAKRAGVAKGTIYLHFNDKEALFRGVDPDRARAADQPSCRAAAIGRIGACRA